MQATSSSSSSSNQGVEELPGPRNAFVPGQESESRRQLFNRISPVYDELNDRLSLGQHRVWKRMAVKWAGAAPGQRALDVCCGSGDLALLLAAAVGQGGSVTGLDFAADMLQDASSREAAATADAPWQRSAKVTWVQGDALELPFDDASFDAATMGYGLRNVADIPKALAELRRVLVPGGKAAVLDFNNSSQPLVDSLQGLLLEQVVVPAAASYGLGDEYRYLRPSIKRFPNGREQEALARQVGFRSAVHYEIGFGMMGCLVATK